VVGSGRQCTERTSKEEKGKSKGVRGQVILTFATVAEVHPPDTSGTLDSTQAIHCLSRVLEPPLGPAILGTPLDLAAGLLQSCLLPQVTGTKVCVFSCFLYVHVMIHCFVVV
jgi:hypothetical protein